MQHNAELSVARTLQKLQTLSDFFVTWRLRGKNGNAGLLPQSHGGPKVHKGVYMFDENHCGVCVYFLCGLWG